MLYRIEKEYEKIKVTDAHKEAVADAFKNERFVKLQGWENVRQRLTFHYPDYSRPFTIFSLLIKKCMCEPPG